MNLTNFDFISAFELHIILCLRFGSDDRLAAKSPSVGYSEILQMSLHISPRGQWIGSSDLQSKQHFNIMMMRLLYKTALSTRSFRCKRERLLKINLLIQMIILITQFENSLNVAMIEPRYFYQFMVQKIPWQSSISYKMRLASEIVNPTND